MMLRGRFVRRYFQQANFYRNSCTYKFRLKSDLIVVLDMDECLIHSQFISNNNAATADSYRQIERRPSKASIKLLESFRISLPDGDIVQVNKRPGLDDFLNEVSRRFETHVFTAAMEVYACPVLDYLDPTNNIFANRFYRECCSHNAELGCYVKNLQIIREGMYSDSLTDFRRMVSLIFRHAT